MFSFPKNCIIPLVWEKEFSVIKPKKNTKGNRYFSKEDVKNIELIYHLVKEKGYTLEGAKVYLKTQKKQALENFEIIRKLNKIKADLEELS